MAAFVRAPLDLDDDLAARCRELAKPDRTQFAISLFILVGILVSYLPQHYTIVARRSSAGISPYFVLLGTTSLSFAFAYMLALPASRDDMACCRVNNALSCFAGVLGVLQIAVQFFSFWLILLLWLLFFPRATAFAPPQPVTAQPSYKTAITIGNVCVVHALALAVVNAWLTSRHAEVLQWYANGIGLAATVLAVLQYLPQLWTTYSLKSVGSLSIPMMCIQTPGSYVWAASLAARLGWAGWSIWGLYIMTGTLQGCILTLGIVYELRNRRERKRLEEEGEGENEAYDDDAEERDEHGGDISTGGDEIRDETTPLIGGTGHKDLTGGLNAELRAP